MVKQSVHFATEQVTKREVLTPEEKPGYIFAKKQDDLDVLLSIQLPAISQDLESQNLVYSSAIGQDCSGIYHKIKDAFINKNQQLLKDEKYLFPPQNKYRSSRQIAHWYYKHQNFQFVNDPTRHTKEIKPGSVLFFARSGKNINTKRIEVLCDNNNNYSSEGAINHIAVVTSVKRNSDGELLEYTMMHAHNKKRKAERSTSKKIQSKYKSLPAFGNWNQQLVGISHMCTIKG